MRVEQIGPAACRSYLVSCEKTGQALLVDPLMEDEGRVVRKLEEDGLTLSLIVDTHTHADHLSGGAALRDKLGVPYALHESTTNRRPDEKLADGARIEVGRGTVEILHTPGHTPDSISLLTDGRLMSGDFLFLAQDGAGRLDLPGGDAGAHWDSLQRLASIGAEVSVLPGHDYQGLTDGPLGVERRRNPRFQDVTREEYVAWQRAVARDTPAWMLEVIAMNLGTAEMHAVHHGAPGGDSEADDVCSAGGACAAGPVAAMPMITPTECHARRAGADAPFLVDVREPWEYAQGHAPGALLIPLGDLPRRLDELPQARDRELHMICRSGARSASAAAFLIDNGWRRVFNVATGTVGWITSGLALEN